jgi:SAM-dependent methyltransferase
MTAEVDHPLFARFAEFIAASEGPVEVDRRRETLAGLSGRVIEIGSGSGPNFRHYPDAVSELVAVEPEAHLRAKAVEAARESGKPVRVVDAVADRLPFENGSFDAAVAVLVLCSVPSQAAALGELHRVVRPGGELRFYEHVRSRRAGFARYQDAVAKVWPRLMGGCRPNVDTLAAIERNGFQVTTCRGFGFPAAARAYPVAPRILGVARVADS